MDTEPTPQTAPLDLPTGTGLPVGTDLPPGTELPGILTMAALVLERVHRKASTGVHLEPGEIAEVKYVEQRIRHALRNCHNTTATTSPKPTTRP